jgi:hypothetical protein
VFFIRASVAARRTLRRNAESRHRRRFQLDTLVFQEHWSVNHFLAGLGVQGHAHCGATVKHRSRVAQDATQLNLRQVHLIAHPGRREVEHVGERPHPGDEGNEAMAAAINLHSLF